MSSTAHAQLVPILRWLFHGEPSASPVVEERARLLLLDTIGCIVAGLGAPTVRAWANALAEEAPGDLHLPVVQCSLSPMAASPVLAAAAVWDEACEGLARAHGRPGVGVIAACLPLALRDGTSLRRLLDALVAGYEIGARLGEWLRIKPGMHVDAGWPALGVAAGDVQGAVVHGSGGDGLVGDVGDGGARAVAQAMFAVVAFEHHGVADRESQAPDRGVRTEPAVGMHMSSCLLVQLADVVVGVGEHHDGLVGVRLVGVPPVLADALVQLGDGVLDVDAAVGGVGGEGLEGSAVAQVAEGVAFPRVRLAVVRLKTDGVAFGGDRGEQPSGPDGRELEGVADHDDAGVALTGVGEDAGESAGVGHGGLVDHQHPVGGDVAIRVGEGGVEGVGGNARVVLELVGGVGGWGEAGDGDAVVL